MKLHQYIVGLILASALVSTLDLFAADVVPQAERENAEKKGFSGPTENRGITSVKAVASVKLGDEFEGLQGRVLRMREIVIAPGGIVAVHEHNQRPGLAYILEGEIIEHRNDQAEPIVRKSGDTAFEKTGVAHWWENRSQKPVRALVIDIFPES